MINYFQKKFAMSNQGAKDLRAAILWHSFLNLSFLLPVIAAFIFLDDYIKVLLSGASPTRSLLFYIVFALVALMVMYLIAFVDYKKTFTKVYNESASRRIKLAETLRKLPLSFFGQKDVADLSSTIMEDATQIETLFSHSVPQIFAALVTMTLMGLSMFFYNWQMSLAIFWVVPLAFLIFYLSRKMMARDHAKIYQIKRDISSNIQDGIDMVQEIKSYNQEESYLNRLNAQLDDYEKTLINTELIAGALMNISHFMFKLGFPSVVFAGAYFLSHGSISIFTYIVFLVIVGRIYDPFIETMNHFGALLYLDVRINRMKEMDSMPMQEGKTEFYPNHYDITFKEVYFSYQEGMQTLQNVSFTAKQGEVTALIGPSGGGKSTVAKLSARFWDIEKGVITLGGEDISQIEPEVLLKNFSIVFQDVALFNSTVMENIRLGKKEASDAEVKTAANLAQCDEFINKLPDGYNTLIGENGERLSGGERQRISIARALLKDAPVILLDEATASLDAENETKIQRAINELVKDKTVLIIAHRMRTIANADKIIAIQDGKIAEMGSPEELKKQKGIFRSMLERQGGQ